MSVEPPSSGRPTGPPSGPLSGPSGPPSQPPSPPPGGGGSQGGEPRRPWWKSVPRVATLTTAVVVAAALGMVLTRSGDSSGKHGEVFLQAANSSGQDPFTESTATKSSAVPASAAPAASAGAGAPANEVRGVDGGAPGLYSGTQNAASCDVEQQVKYFQASPSRNKAFAAQVGVQPSGVPAYLRSLTPVQLRADTRVTTHGYRDGRTTTYQSVLQAGTAVLVDGRGVPRVRCACGNPLTPPVAQRTTPKTTGTAWPAYRPSNVVVVAPAAQIIKVFVVYDHKHHDWFGRHRGDHTGHHDRPARPPANPDPMNPPAHHGCPPASGKPGSPGTTPCPPASSGPSTSPGPGNGSKSPPSKQPSSNSPSAQSPASKPPASSKPPSSEPPSSSSESPKTESPKPESPKPESPGTESPKSEPPKNENESPRTESPKNESPASQPPKSQGPASEPPSSAQHLAPPSPASPGPESAAPASSAQQAPPSSAAPGPVTRSVETSVPPPPGGGPSSPVL